MKTRESGMPPDDMWQRFFDPEKVLSQMMLSEKIRDAVDFGCGFGTFAIPAAKIVRGIVYALDIDPEMVAATQAKADANGLGNLLVRQRDFVADGTGLDENSIDYAMLFNILHSEEPLVLLREAWRILRPQGILAITHWNYDPTTPRGPSMAIRPRPELCLEWSKQVGFSPAHKGIIDLPPYHFGLVLIRGDSI
jgi:SAM-dependent methyltransferase